MTKFNAEMKFVEVKKFVKSELKDYASWDFRGHFDSKDNLVNWISKLYTLKKNKDHYLEFKELFPLDDIFIYKNILKLVLDYKNFYCLVIT